MKEIVIKLVRYNTTFRTVNICRVRPKCDGTRARNQISSFGETDESISIGRGASVQSTYGSRGVRISGSNAGYTMFRGSVKGTGYPLYSPVSPSLPLPPVGHHVPPRFNWTLPCHVCTTHFKPNVDAYLLNVFVPYIMFTSATIH